MGKSSLATGQKGNITQTQVYTVTNPKVKFQYTKRKAGRGSTQEYFKGKIQ